MSHVRVRKAINFAIKAHQDIGQVRKYTGEPYYYHCNNVAEIVRSVAGSDDMVAAAWLHDVLEDTPVTSEDLVKEFSTDVVVLVTYLTDPICPPDWNRAKRKEHTCKLFKAIPSTWIKQVHTIKLADLIDNSHSIIEHDPKFAKVFISEMEDLIEALAWGYPTLHARAKRICKDYREANV